MAGSPDSCDFLQCMSSDDDDVLLDAEGECSVTLTVHLSYCPSGRRRQIVVNAARFKLARDHRIHVNSRGPGNIPWFHVVSYGSSLGGSSWDTDGTWPIEWNHATGICILHISGYQLTWRVSLSRARKTEKWKVMCTDRPDVQAL